MTDDERWMRLALAEAERAAAMGEVPVGAVVVRGDEVVGRGHAVASLYTDGCPAARCT